MVLTIIHTVIAILLIACILFQMQGSGLSTAFGGSGEFYRSKRSAEKLLIWVTVVLAALFAILSIVSLFPL